MKLPRKIGTLGLASVLAAAGLGTLAYGTGPAKAQQGNPAMMGCPYAGMGYGMMGQGMGQGVGPGMMGQGMGPGPMGPGMSQGYGPGPMGPGMGQGYGYGPGPMGPGMGPGMMGQGMGPGMMGQGMGPGMMGQGMGPGMMGQGMGPGMMGQGMGPGMMGQGMGPGAMQVLPEDLDPEQVRHMFEHRLSWHNNPNIKVGDVTEADEDTITVDIVTQDGSLVQRFAVDRHTGTFRQAQ